MKLGDNILKLRKDNHLSQEQLAEKINVTRQTISNWELGETSPNPEQLKLLSKTLNVSIDELLDNDIKEILEKRISNTEKLAGIIIKILKVFGIFIILYFVLIIVAIILFTAFPNEPSVEKISSTMYCSIEDNEYEITIGSDNYFDCPKCTKDMTVYLKDITDWANIEHSIENIEKYFTDNGGSCK